jgi:predicted Zn-dependent peptidase
MSTRKNNVHPKMYIINGYKVLLVPRGHNVLHIECVIRNGFCTESKHMSGINHLLEHMMVEGWKQCKTSCNTYWDMKGYSINASTDKTTMKYYIKGLNKEWKQMLTFIINILDNPNITHERLQKEKQAVIEELLTYSSDTESNLDNVFNHHFYKTDGLKFADDWKLQIDNLKHISVRDIKDIYEKYFNVQNIMFIVMGDFNEKNIKKVFKEQLKNPKHGNLMTIDCYTNHHTVIYSKGDIENTKVVLGFPSSSQYNYIYLNSITQLLHILLFDELRTKTSLVYDIEIDEELNACGSAIFIRFDVQTIHVVEVIKRIYNYIKQLQTVPLKDIHGFKNQEIYNYITNKNSIMNYYLSLLFVNGPLYTKKQIIQLIHNISTTNIIHLFQTILPLDKVLCVYQSKKNLNLSWEKLI